MAGNTSERSRTNVVCGMPIWCRLKICRRTQLVARVHNAVRRVRAVHVHLLELPDHGRAEICHRRADPRQHGVVAREPLGMEVKFRVALFDVDGEPERVEHFDFMPALQGGIAQSPRAVTLQTSREDAEFQAKSLSECRVRGQKPGFSEKAGLRNPSPLRGEAGRGVRRSSSVESSIDSTLPNPSLEGRGVDPLSKPIAPWFELFTPHAGRLSRVVRAARIDHKFPAQRFAAQQHPETHFVPVCQRQFNRPTHSEK